MATESGIMEDMNGDSGPKRLERKLNGRMLAGVCAGLADYLGVDPTLVRVIFAVLAFVGGTGVVAYLVAWALIPEEGEPVSIAEKILNKDGSA
jgi:phage shock protein PspC (stress-responsive transcriptional regulator)